MFGQDVKAWSIDYLYKKNNMIIKENKLEYKELREKITKILTDELCYCYCDNCEFGNWDKYQNEECCDDCHRKYQNWRLSKDTAKELAKRIIEEINND